MRMTKQRQRLFTNSQRKLMSALGSLGVELELIEGTNILEISYKNNKELLIGSYTPLVPQNIGYVLSNKFFTYKLLQDASFFVPEMIRVPVSDPRAVRTLSQVGPTNSKVVKSENSQIFIKSQSVDSDEKLKAKVQQLHRQGVTAVVQNFVQGDTLKLAITQDGYVHALQKVRRPVDNTIVLSSNAHQLVTDWQDVTHLLDKSYWYLAEKVRLVFPGMKAISFLCKTKHVSQPTSIKELAILEVYHGLHSHFGYQAVSLNKNIDTSFSVEDVLAKLIVEQMNND